MINLATLEKRSSPPSPTESVRYQHTHELIRKELDKLFKNPDFLQANNLPANFAYTHYLQGSY